VFLRPAAVLAASAMLIWTQCDHLLVLTDSTERRAAASRRDEKSP